MTTPADRVAGFFAGAYQGQPRTYKELRESGTLHRCPLCDVPWKAPPSIPGRRQTPYTRTRAHVLGRLRLKHLWILLCAGCNTEQGSMTMVEWLVEMALANDPRALRLKLVLEAVLAR